MKIRSDFVTNSSSSCFTLEIRFDLKNGQSIVFEGEGGTGENGGTEFFNHNAVAKVSPKQLGLAKDIDELISFLTDGIVDQDEWEETEVRIFENVESKAYKFIKEIREEIKSVDDIKTITISGDEFNYGRDYVRSFKFDKETNEYTGTKTGRAFDHVDGTHAGDVCMPDLNSCKIFRK